MIPEGCDTDEKPYKDPGIRKCDLVPPYCQGNEDSGDDHGHNSGAHADAYDPNSPVEEAPKEEEASAPGAVKAGEVPGGQMADGTSVAREGNIVGPVNAALGAEALIDDVVELVDAAGDAAKAVWDKVTSWF